MMRFKGMTHQEFLAHVESHATKLRMIAGMGRTAPLDPWHLASKLECVVMTKLSEIVGLSDEVREQLLTLDASIWSGMSSELPDGRLLIVLNDNQTRERAAVTLMEELAHRHFGHRPELLSIEGDAGIGRQFNQDDEAEAYWTAAASLLPRYAVARRIWRRESTESIARHYGTSRELVEFRVKILGLWNDVAVYSAS